MIQPGRFGPFLLFQETESNLYRSCYRAGVTRGRAVERVVRLEVFDRPGFDPAELLTRLESSTQIQTSLQDPHIAAGAGLGHIEGVPYAAYDFELGTTLAAFSRAARERSFPVPLDQALFIAERVALALAAAFRVERQGRPSLHSFLTPDAVLLSNVGEVKVCGFEIAPSLRLKLNGESFCAPYLSPECRAGQARQAQDDVFSLGSLLFELVTGKAPSPESPELDPVIVQATGEPAPQGLQSLLQSSLAVPADRIPHVLDWQRSLGKLILDGDYNPTTFNLSFLLHTLLREPLERGVESLEREKRFVLPHDDGGSTEDSTARIEQPAAPASGGLEAENELPPADVGLVAPPRSTDRKPFWLGFSISVITASALLGGVLVLGGHSEMASVDSVESKEVAPPLRTDLNPPSPETAEVATGPAKPHLVLTEVVQGQLEESLDSDEIEREIAQRTAEIERALAAEYEKRLETLRSEMSALRAIEERTAEVSPAESLPSTATAASEPIATGPAADLEADQPLEQPENVANRPEPNGPPEQGEQALRAQEPRPEMLGEDRGPSPASTPGREVRLDVTSADLAAQQPQTPAQLLRLNPPQYPPAAKRLGLSATARVRVVISAKGQVRDAEILGPELGSGFDRAALAAVRRSKWTPATRAGEPVESTSVVAVQFQP